MSTPEKRPTVRINIADINQDGLSQADKEGLTSAFTEEYKKRLRDLLPGLDLRFIKRERDQGDEPAALRLQRRLNDRAVPSDFATPPTHQVPLDTLTPRPGKDGKTVGGNADAHPKLVQICAYR